MVDNIDSEIAAGLKDAFKNTQVDTTGAEFQNVINDKPVIETVAPEVKPVVVDSSLTDENNAAQDTTTVVDTETTPVVENAATEIAPVKTADEIIAERSGGKYKNWEDVEAEINAPKLKFKNDQAKHIYELAEKGVEFTPEFFELQSKDFESMTNPVTALMEAMKLKPEYKGLPDSTIEFQIKKKYNLDSWAEKKDGVWMTKEDYEMTEEDQANHDILSRDGEKDLEWLINYKNERVFAKQPDENQLRQAAESERQAQESWEKSIDEVSKSVLKLSTKIDDNDVVDFDLSETDKKYASDMVKSMGKDLGVFWNQFSDDKGNIDKKAVYEMVLYLKNKENIVKIAHQNALAKGKEAEIKTIKNTQFTPNPTSPTAKVDWRLKAQEQVEKNL